MKIATVLRDKRVTPHELHIEIHTHGQPRPRVTACGQSTKGMHRSSDPEGQMDRLHCPGCVAALEV